MIKRIAAALLSSILIMTFLPILSTEAFAQDNSITSGTGTLDNFVKINDYQPNQFTDVSATSWYAQNVATAYELGLMIGSSSTYFNVNGKVQISEVITMAARIHSIYTTGSSDFQQKSPWYQTYVDYAISNGIISGSYPDYGKSATRYEFATILEAALPDEALPIINYIEPGCIPDVPVSAPYADAVYSLYEAGILTGTDRYGTFNPNATIARSETAAIITRMAMTSLRKTFSLEKKPIEAESITLTGDTATTVGSEITIAAAFKPENTTDQTLVWESSDKTIAVVNNEGVVNAVNPGVVTITATTANGKKATHKITINLKPVSVANGMIKWPSGSRLAPVRINAPSDASVYVYFQNDSNSSNDFSVFVSAGTTVEVDAPLGTYTVYYAQGTTWYGTTYKFGVGTGYFKSDSAVELYFDGIYYNGVELTLYKVLGGNMATESIDEGDFPG